MPAHRRYFKELRICQLRALTKVAETRSFAAAAQALDLTTPSVWQQVRSLEEQFQVGLVHVKGGRVILTDHGQLMVKMAGPVLHSFDALREEFSQQSAELPRKLSIAAPANVLVSELPSPIRRFHDEYPNVELSLIDASSLAARQLVENQQVDLAVAGLLDSAAAPRSLVAEVVTSFPFMLVCPVGHPLLSLKRISPRSLVRHPLVMSATASNTRSRVDEVFARAGLQKRVKVVFEANSKDLLLQYVGLGFGVSIAPISPRYATTADAPYGDIQGLAFRDMSQTFGHEHIAIFRHRGRRERVCERHFRDIVLSSAEETGPAAT